MDSWIKSVANNWLGWILLIVGAGLIAVAAIDLWRALHKDTKEWGKAFIGIVIGIIGAILFTWSASGLIGFVSNKKDSIPHQ
ncbi:hypothetical protein [Lactobacillus sp.]|uniref:hypothetical protein n=1 Tax=Lactobacillus sp. TaxID=1591 RepID=UPI00198CFBCA|nr:hypothetical protein [Lactobacillus sp.]MBD5430795.1 hypothetical protein [Lactobacillus sp.]